MGTFEKIYKIVCSIPHGKVASYGQIAAMAGHPRGAQMVGWALHQLEENKAKKIPWQRVINARGEISTTCHEHNANLQAELLQKEGVKIEFTKEGIGKIDLKKYGWIY